MQQVVVYDPTASDEASRVRGVGRYMQILRENFSHSAAWQFSNNVAMEQWSNDSVLINPFVNFLQPPLITRRLATKQIGIIHDLIPLKYPSHFPAGLQGAFNIFRNKQALKYYDALVTDSEASKRDLVRMLRISEAKVHVIYPTLPRVFTNPKWKVESGKWKINSQLSTLNSQFYLYVGDVTWNKNLVNLAHAIKLADVTCVFVGKAFDDVTRATLHATQNPWLNDFHEFAKEVMDDPRFIFPGFVEDKDLVTLYQNAVANILVSRDEGFGFSYLEAAAVGTPSILSDIPVFREIAGDAAVFVDPNDPNALTTALKDASKSSKKVFDNLKERVNKFDSEKFKQGWESVLS